MTSRGAELIPRPARDARARATRAVDHFAAHDQRPFTAPDEHDVEAVVVNFGNSVRVPTNHSEAVGSGGTAVVEERLAGGAVLADPSRERDIPLGERRGAPQGKSRSLGL